jgi:N-acetyl-alpha-D-glucosaminyl L-malate synthase BshA
VSILKNKPPGRKKESGKFRLGIVCYPTFGGSGVVAVELGQALAARGHQVHIISTDLPARLRPVRDLTFHRVQVVSYPLFEYPPYTLALATKIADVIRQESLDLIHVHYAIPHSIAAILGQDMASCRVKIVTTLHGTDVQLVGLEPSYWEVTRYGMLRSSGITAVSRSLAETTIKEFHLNREVRVIPNFIDTRTFRRRPNGRRRRKMARPDEKIILHVSNFRELKRPWEAVEIFHGVAAALPARLYMIGEGPERKKAEQTATRLGLDDKVHFIPFVDRIQDWLSQADLLIHPSEMESFGLVSLEAMSCGVPVVAYRVGGLPEVVSDGESGHLLEVGDIEGAVAKATALLQEGDRWESFSRQGQETARKKFSLGRVVPRYENYFREVLAT